MALAQALWYFSNMGDLKGPIRLERNKYGMDLALDARFTNQEPTYRTRTPHSLDFWEIQLVLAGSLRARLGGGPPDRSEAGTILVTPRLQTRTLELTPSCHRWLLCFAPDALEELRDPLLPYRLGFLRHGEARRKIQADRKTRDWLVDRLGEMTGELAQPDVNTPALLGFQLAEILLKLNRLHAKGGGVAHEATPSPTALKFLELLEERYMSTRRVADYAALLGVSAGHLRNLVRREFGEAPKALILKRVLAEAQRLLLGTNQTMSAIADSLGFSDESYFSRFFCDRAGLRPGEFRSKGLQSGGICARAIQDHRRRRMPVRTGVCDGAKHRSFNTGET
ncbi:MAG: helix-turn-helix domain-containing protein [Thermoanaerobaculia bacterium]